MKIASLFSGIGGFEKGILQADPTAEIVFASEFDPDSKANNINKQPARQIYRKNFGWWPDGDITKINASDVPGHDILCGGFPCTDVSIAGKRAGLCGARSGLFYEIIRIVREKKPKLVFLENVKGLLSSNDGWDFAKILIELESVGYESEWQVLNTAAFLPQRRERIFIIGHLTGPGESGRKIFPIEKINGQVTKKGNGDSVCTGAISTRNQSGRVQWDGSTTLICNAIDANYYKGPDGHGQRTTILCDSGKNRTKQIRTKNIAPLRANTGAGHNNVMCHSTFNRSGNKNKGGTGHLQRNDGLSYCCDADNSIAIELNYLNPEAHTNGCGNAKKTNAIEILRILWEAVGEDTGERWGFTELTSLLETEILQPRMHEKSIQASLEEECSRSGREISGETISYCNRMLEMWEQEKFRHTSHRQKRIEQLIGELISSVQELSQLCTSKKGYMQNMWKTSERTGLLQQALPEIQKVGKSFDGKAQSIHRTTRIRRLVPTEIEKLQGFPVNWTAEGIDSNGNTVEISDTQRYKTLGNAVSVPVIEFIYRHIMDVM